MDVADVKERRTKLAVEIAELIGAFQAETGVIVKEIKLRHLLTVTSEVPVKAQVEIQAELP